MSKQPTKQPKKQTTGRPATVSTADPDLRRHLRALGLADADAYLIWCRGHGFGDSLHKSWQERRQEREAVRRAEVDASAASALRGHLDALGLADTDEYENWCRERGLSAALQKSAGQHQKEVRLAQDERARTALAGARRLRRNPRALLQGLFDGSREPLPPLLEKAQELIARTEGEPKVREALRSLLLHVQAHSRLLSAEPAVSHFGVQAGNTPIEAMLALARHCDEWRRPVEGWRPESHNLGRQFGALARHLLADYEVPPFMDAAWFAGETEAARMQQAWFLHIGRGRNIRTAVLPLRLTKRAAHLLPQAPRDLPIPAAFRWAQVVALGGSQPLAQAILGTLLGDFQEDEAFWESVLHFFVNNPLLDTACVGPIVDFIQHQRFTPQEGNGAAPAPDFSMKGRTADALQERVEEWHQTLALPNRKTPLQWDSTGLRGFRSAKCEYEDGETVYWVVEELLSGAALREEGKAMRHCVASYKRSCAKGQKSVWSLGVEDCRTQARRRVMTIAVQNGSRTITEARGRCNKVPGGRHASPRLDHAPVILRQWAAQEGLTVPSYV